MEQTDYRALILDDEPEICNILASVLEREGFAAITTNELNEALDLLRSYPFDIIISDFYVRGSTAVDFFKHVKREFPQIPFMIITGKPDVDIAVSMLKDGVSDFLQKPLHLATFAEKVHRAIRIGHSDSANRNLVSELRQILKKRISELRIYQDLFESKCEGLLILDSEGIIVRVNSGFVEITGLPEETFNGMPISAISDFFSEKPDFRQICGHLQKHGRWQQETTIHPPARVSLLVRISCSPICEESGRTFAYAIIVTDISEIRAMQTALLESVKQRSRANEAIIFGLARLAEYRDPETGFHLERIRNYCRLLANAMALEADFADIIDREYVEVLYNACPLHDIGKVGIPDYILLKKGKLTDKEFAYMKKHSTIGYETLRAIRDQYGETALLKMGMDIAHAHHERFDGKGYPLGMRANDIPLSAQITAIADVYDALTSRRVYKPPFSHQQALDIMTSERDTHFNPRIFDIFLSIQHEFDTVRRDLPGEPEE